jgi:hypothetical protein
MGDHTKNSKKSPYTSSDYSSLKLILLVDGCQCDYITKSKEKKKKKKQNLGIILKYDKNLFSLKLHFPKKLLDFGFFRDKKLRMNICYLKIWGQKIGKSRPEKTRKHQLPPTLINPKVIEVFEDCILKGWGSAECRNRYCVFSCPHLHH